MVSYFPQEINPTFNLPPAHVVPLGLYAGVFSGNSNKRITFDLGRTTSGAYIVGFSTSDRYSWVAATSSGTVQGGGSGSSSGSTWSDKMYANNASASGAIAKNVIKY